MLHCCLQTLVLLASSSIWQTCWLLMGPNISVLAYQSRTPAVIGGMAFWLLQRSLLTRLLQTVDGGTRVPLVPVLSWRLGWIDFDFEGNSAWCVFCLLCSLFLAGHYISVFDLACFFVLLHKSLNSTSGNICLSQNILPVRDLDDAGFPPCALLLCSVLLGCKIFRWNCHFF